MHFNLVSLKVKQNPAQTGLFPFCWGGSNEAKKERDRLTRKTAIYFRIFTSAYYAMAPEISLGLISVYAIKGEENFKLCRTKIK